MNMDETAFTDHLNAEQAIISDANLHERRMCIRHFSNKTSVNYCRSAMLQGLYLTILFVASMNIKYVERIEPLYLRVLGRVVEIPICYFHA